MEFFKDKSSKFLLELFQIYASVCVTHCNNSTFAHFHKSLVSICQIFKSVGVMMHTYIFEAAMLQANQLMAYIELMHETSTI